MTETPRVALFFDSEHLGQWTLREGFNHETALSGTDRPLLWLWSQFLGINNATKLYVTRPPSTMLSGVVCSRNIAQAIELASLDGVDVMITHNIGEDQIITGVDASKKFGVKFILWDQNGLTHRVRQKAAEESAFACIVCVSTQQADEHRHTLAFKKTTVIYNCIDSEFWTCERSQIEPKLIVYLGSLTPSKGFHHLARAWPKIRAVIPSARLIVCGSAKLYQSGAVVGRLGVASREYEDTEIIPYIGSSRQIARDNGVEFLGKTTPEQTRNALASARLAIVNPNVTGSVECCSMASLEVQACGVPLIAGKAGGLLETVADGYTGRLISNPGKLDNVIIKELQNQYHNRLNTKERLAHLAKFDPIRIRQEWVSLVCAVKQGAPITMPNFSLRPFYIKRYTKRLLEKLR